MSPLATIRNYALKLKLHGLSGAKPTKVAIHAHVFYPDLWPELANCIRNFDVEYTDIFITYPDTLPESIGDNLRCNFPQATIRRIENRGYDIGPFVDTISRINLDDFDIVVKLHTKRNRRAIVKFLPYWGGMWRRKLLAFCATPEAVQRTLAVFANKPDVGMIGHGDLIMHASDELVPGAASTPPDQDHSFVAGTMFAVRSHLLKRVIAEASFSDFPVMQGRAHSDLSWSWERRIGQLIEKQGYNIASAPTSSRFLKFAQHLAKNAYRIFRPA